jgi:D-sedoheptulose 7-phosphate isomerase
VEVKLSYSKQHLEETVSVVQGIDPEAVEHLVSKILEVKEAQGRIFFLGVGGSAGNASHAVNDFRKIAMIEAYSPADNVSELTARTNDEGWDTTFVEWLRMSKLSSRDALFVLSVGGGDLEKNVSPNIVRAVQLGKSVNAKILGVVGRDGGYTAFVGDAVVLVPTVNPSNITPHAESMQGVIWHLIVSHPLIKEAETKWESKI